MSAQTVRKDLKNEILSAFAAVSGSDALRAEARSAFESMGLPTPKSEEYRYTPIARNLESFLTTDAIANSTATAGIDISAFTIPGLDADFVVFVNGRYMPSLSRISKSENITILPLQEALETQESVSTYFGKLVDFRSDAFAAFNTAFWRDGVAIVVHEDATVEKPILILHIHDARTAPVVAPSRLLLVAESNSRVSVIEKFDTLGTHPVFSSWTEELSVGPRATLNYYKIQNDAGASTQVANTLIHQQDDSRVNTFTATLNGKIVRNNFGIAVDGQRCESHFYGLYLLDKDTLADNHTTVDHRQPNSFTNELYKGILGGNSRGVFNGKIYVRPHAQKTNAFQSNRNILLGDAAVVHTKPQLEIWADDVKCSHGCTSGQLDEEALFYLQSRGIDKDSAQGMLLSAFAGEVFDSITDPVLRSYFDSLLSSRLSSPFR